ncbi:MAG TPA: diguanylate cyclase [Holophagaceae bacterium]|nr:diguanylate cyclase [Holophagaceae bacterium]HJW31808.1 diguanylate cyclase [Holophagaceae bacterium]
MRFRWPFQPGSIRASLAGVVLTTTGLALGLATLAFVADARVRGRQNLATSSKALLEAVEGTAGNALLFQDEALSKEALEPLMVQPHVLAAGLYLPSGQRLYSQSHGFGLLPERVQSLHPATFEGDHFRIHQTVHVRKAAVGTLLLVADTTFLERETYQVLAAAAVILLGAFALAGLWAKRTAERLIRPLEALAASARRVARSGEFHHPVPGAGPSELGRFISDYNAMLSTLGDKDAELRTNRDHFEALVHDRTAALEAANAALERQSLTDPLTGLYNRRFIDLFLHEVVAQTARTYEDHRRGKIELPPFPDLVFLLVDIDHFKQINDHHGHPAGDEFLRQFSRRLQEALREMDTVVRWGGEEFFVVARSIHRDQGLVLAERILEAVRTRPFELGTTRLQGTCSVGFAPFPFDPAHPQNTPWERVVAFADRCLYAAKDSGRDRAVGLTGGSSSPAAQGAFLLEGPGGTEWPLQRSFPDPINWSRGAKV